MTTPFPRRRSSGCVGVGPLPVALGGVSVAVGRVGVRVVVVVVRARAPAHLLPAQAGVVLLLVAVLGHAALLLQAVRALLGAALPVAALVAVAFGALAFFVDAAPLLLAAQAVLLVDALACTALVVAAVVDAGSEEQ